MTQEQKLARANWLAELGVPRPFHNAIIEAPNNLITKGSGTAVGLTLVALAIGIMAATFVGLNHYVHARAAALALQTGATLSYVQVGIGPLTLLFGLLVLVAWAGWALARRYRVKGFLSLAAVMLNSPAKKKRVRNVVRTIVKGSVGRAARSTSNVDDFLRAVASDQARRWGVAAFLLLTPAVVLTALETNSFWVAGPAGIVENRLYPPFSSRRYDLGSVTALTTGCNHTDEAEHLKYIVQFAAGEQFSLGAAKAVKGDLIKAVEQINAKLKGNIAHQRWSHLDRNPLHPACLSYWGRQFDQDGQRRLAKLLWLSPNDTRAPLSR